MSAIEPLVKNIQSQLLSDDWYTLKKYTFDLRRRDVGEVARGRRVALLQLQAEVARRDDGAGVDDGVRGDPCAGLDYGSGEDLDAFAELRRGRD